MFYLEKDIIFVIILVRIIYDDKLEMIIIIRNKIFYDKSLNSIKQVGVDIYGNNNNLLRIYPMLFYKVLNHICYIV